MAADLGGELHVLQGGQVLDQVVELKDEADVVAAVLGKGPGRGPADLPAVHRHPALGGGVHAAQNVEDSGLARAGGPHDDGEFPPLDGEAYVLHRRDGDLAHLIPLDHVLQGDEGHAVHLRVCYPTGVDSTVDLL